jgi:hypothetical protein
MGHRNLFRVLSCALLLCAGLVGFAQESAVKGNLTGVVVDTTGAVVPEAKVSVTGPSGSLTVATDKEGNFLILRLLPGSYTMKVEKQGFKVADVKGIEVSVGRTASTRVQLEPGAVTETIEVTTSAVTVDTTSTGTGSNLSDTFYSSVPVPRNVSGLFYVAPGVADSGGAGRANPSVSGGSGLENLYVADGVNITDTAFGGLGIFTRQYGSVGSGINLGFIKEVQIKTGGFEPQYGQATGGVVQIVTKSGSREYHGALGFYAAPVWGAATPKNVDDFRNRKFGRDAFVANANPVGSGTQAGQYAGPGAYDLSGEIGGYIPRFRNSLFFFGSYNPTLLTDYLTPPQFAGSPAIQPVRAPVGLFTLLDGRPVYMRIFVNNYAAKLTWKINGSNSLESSVFGDPTSTNNAAFRTVNAQNTTVFSSQNYSTRNWVVRYNTTISPTWLANANFTWNHNQFTENPQNPGVFSVVDRTTSGLTPTLSGLGFVENHVTDNFAFGLDTSKVVQWAGQHTFMVGFAEGLLNYNDLKARTGGRFLTPDLGPTRNQAVYGCATPNGQATCPLGFLTNATFSLNVRSTCTLCPLYTTPAGLVEPVALTVSRGEYGPPLVATEGLSYAAFANDSWVVNKHLSFSLGVRWEQYRMAGVQDHYTFTHNWAPRLGVIYDPWGDRKTKIFLNYAQYNYQMPLDAAIRSLSSELDMTNLRFAPIVNADNTISVVPDAAHLLNGLPGGTGGAAIISAQAGGNLEGFAPGTKMQRETEYVAGIEREIGKGFVIAARYVDRRLNRVVEDMGGVSPEAADFGPPLNQFFLIGNPSKSLDLFTNEPTPLVQPQGAACASGNVSAVDGNGFPFANGQQACFPANLNGVNGLPGGTPMPDGIPDGFANPVRNYQAGEFELNKGFSNGWLMRFNYRLAYLRGNYEGAFRNDNGQTDPSISSLFDFTTGVLNLLGDQFAIGPLNTERHQVANLFVSYTFDRSRIKGLTLGTGMRVLSGTPVSEFANHPVYGNQGEVPIGGRGKLGRTPVSGGIDLHAEYAHKLSERFSVHVAADMFNVTNSMPITLKDQNRDLSFQAPFSNADFLTPLNFQNPFYGRFGVKLQF